MKASDMMAVAGFIAALGFFGYAFLRAVDTPDVIFSYSTGECRRVDLPDGSRGDCARLPERYNHIWGE